MLKYPYCSVYTQFILSTYTDREIYCFIAPLTKSYSLVFI